MAQVKLSATELIAITNLIETVAHQGKNENGSGLYIDFMYVPASLCLSLSNILQHISMETYGYTTREEEFCNKLRNASK